MTVRALQKHRAAIVDFHNAYDAYLAGGPRGDPQLRANVFQLAPRAQSAMVAAGTNPVMYPPRAFGGPVRDGLVNIMFAHELWGVGGDQVVQNVLDWCRVTDARLDERGETLRQQRRNPLFWVDRLLRLVLGIPAYLVSLLVRKPFSRIDNSGLGTMLRIISAAGSVAAIYFGGAEAAWW